MVSGDVSSVKARPAYIDIFYVPTDSPPKNIIHPASGKKHESKVVAVEPAPKKSLLQAAVTSQSIAQLAKLDPIPMKKFGTLLPPPPFESSGKFEWKEPNVIKAEPVKVLVTVAEAIPIPSDAHISRLELSNIVTAHTAEYLEKWKTLVQLELDGNFIQMGDRLDLIQRLKDEREEMKRKELEEAQPPKVVRLDTPEKGKMRKVK